MFGFVLPYFDDAILVIVNVTISLVSFLVNIRAARVGAKEYKIRYTIVAFISIYMGILFVLAFSKNMTDETAAFFISACFGVQWIVMGIWPAISEPIIFNKIRRKANKVLYEEEDT